jgi:hypothetical protein
LEVLMLDPKEQKSQHGTSGNFPCEASGNITSGLSLECDAPSSYQEEAADSRSKDWWKELIQDPLETADVREGTCTPNCKGLEASLVPTSLLSKDVWVIDPALAEAINGGLSRSKSSNLVVRQSGSTGYRVETVCVEKLQNIWHPLKWGDNDEVLPYKQSLKQKAVSCLSSNRSHANTCVNSFAFRVACNKRLTFSIIPWASQHQWDYGKCMRPQYAPSNCAVRD